MIEDIKWHLTALRVLRKQQQRAMRELKKLDPGATVTADPAMYFLHEYVLALTAAIAWGEERITRQGGTDSAADRRSRETKP